MMFCITFLFPSPHSKIPQNWPWWGGIYTLLSLKSLLSHVWLSGDPIDCSPPGSSVHGTLQARILEWIAIPFSRGSSWPRDQTWVSCIADGFFTIWATRGAQEIVKDRGACRDAVHGVQRGHDLAPEQQQHKVQLLSVKKQLVTVIRKYNLFSCALDCSS